MNRATRRERERKREKVRSELLQPFTIVYGCIAWRELEEKLGSRWESFCDFMYGQTFSEHGVYACDVETFLMGLPCLD